ncbi:MAG: hypothetical protein ACRDKW_07700 [Actinomycetota bacterium]
MDREPRQPDLEPGPEPDRGPEREQEPDPLDEAVEGTFPASDPPSETIPAE